MHVKTILILLTAFAAFLSPAVVYLPGITGRSPADPVWSELPGMNRQLLLEEKAIVNGVPLNLQIYQLNSTLPAVKSYISRSDGGAKIDSGKDYLRAIFKRSAGGSERWLFVSSGHGRPLTAFKMELDSKLPPPPFWPEELPQLPAGGRPGMVMELPGLQAIYGSFDSCNDSPEQLLSSYSARLNSAGWSCAGAEHSPAIRGSGDMFIRTAPQAKALWIKFSENGNGAFYIKNLNSK